MRERERICWTVNVTYMNFHKRKKKISKDIRTELLKVEVKAFDL